MKIYRDISEVKLERKTVVTIGTFDGIHLGHADIINFVSAEAERMNEESFVVTFEPHPRSVVKGSGEIKILTALEEKAALFEKFNVNNLLVIEFNLEFAQIGYDEFVKSYLLERLNAEHLVIGHDHHFGRNRGGNEDSLLSLSKELGYRLTVIPAVSVKGIEVSSSKIRHALENGELEAANSMLGRSYSVKGLVVEGVQRGREIGFPTANIEPLPKQKLIPKSGVYAVRCKIEGKTLKGVLNIGTRPTFENNEKIIIELHIFDFTGDLYGKSVELEFAGRIRDEKKFGSVEELVNQINKDIEKAKQILN